PSLMMTIEARDPDKASTDPTDRSISAAIKTSVEPAAMIAIVEACRRMLRMFVCVKKYGDANARPSQISPSATKIPPSCRYRTAACRVYAERPARERSRLAASTCKAHDLAFARTLVADLAGEAAAPHDEDAIRVREQ